MGETDYLKAKCNALIDEALQKKKELEEIDLEIQRLQSIKDSLIARLEQEFENDMEEQIHLEMITPDNNENVQNLSQEQFAAFQTQMLQKMNELGEKIQIPQQEPERIRKVSVKEKTREIAIDIIHRAGKLLLMVLLMGIFSLATTILLNDDLRNMLIELLKECVR